MKSRDWKTVLLLRLAIVFIPISPAAAKDAREIGWEDLIPKDPVEFDDPFAKLSEQQLHDLGQIARIRMLRERDAIDADGESAQQEKEAVAKFEAEGIDVDWILSQRERVARERQKQAEQVDEGIDGSEVRVPGYVLPLKSGENGITEFLLVPWVGACIHTPPPPPNQMVHVTVPEGIPDRGLFAPIWIEGSIELKPGRYDLFLIDGSAVVNVAYSMASPAISEYSAKDSGVLAQVEVPSGTPDHGWFRNLQTRVSLLFTKTMTSIRDRESAGPLWWGLLISFVYGLVHTLGPGHGKAVVASYFIGHGGSLGRGLTVGIRIALFHVLSAVLVVGLTDFAVRQATGSAPSDYRAVRLVSYAGIAAIGLWMLLRALRVARRPHSHEHGDEGGEHPHTHQGHDCLACAAMDQHDHRAAGWLSVLVGAVPCTGALLVLLFGFANDLLLPSIALVMAISLGMAFALSAIGVAAILGRRIVSRRMEQDAARSRRFTRAARIAGASCILMIGIGLLLMTWTRPSFPAPASAPSQSDSP